jgi:hypothetical protein
MARKPIAEKPMTSAERVRKHREKLNEIKQNTKKQSWIMVATDNELVNELERRGFEVTLYVEPHPFTKAAIKQKKKIQREVINQNIENKVVYEIFGNNTPEGIAAKMLNNWTHPTLSCTNQGR